MYHAEAVFPLVWELAFCVKIRVGVLFSLKLVILLAVAIAALFGFTFFGIGFCISTSMDGSDRNHRWILDV